MPLTTPRLRVLESRCLLAASAAGAEIDLPATTEIEAGTSVKFGIRPEHLAATHGIAVDVTVDAIEQLGSTSFVYATTASAEPLVAGQRLGDAQSGGPATLRFQAANARLFDANGARIR